MTSGCDFNNMLLLTSFRSFEKFIIKNIWLEKNSENYKAHSQIRIKQDIGKGIDVF